MWKQLVIAFRLLPSQSPSSIFPASQFPTISKWFVFFSLMSYGIEYSFVQFKSALLVLFTSNSLYLLNPTPLLGQ